MVTAPRSHLIAVTLTAALASAVLGPAGAARAQPAGGNTELAKRHYDLAEEYHKLQRYEDAANSYLEAFRLSGRPFLLFNTGLMYYKLGDLPRAVEQFRRYIELEPDGDRAAEARKYIREHEDREARRLAEQRARERAAAATAEHQAGLALWQRAERSARAHDEAAARRDRAAAVERFRKSLQIDPAHDHAADARRYIDELERLRLIQPLPAPPVPEPAPDLADAADAPRHGLAERLRAHGRLTLDTAVCQNLLGDKDERALSAICGASLAIGAGYAAASWLDLRVAGLIGGTLGVYAGADARLLRTRVRPVVSAGLPVFFSAGPRAGLRVAAGVEARLTSRVSAAVQLAYERYLDPEPDTPDMDILPILGLRARM